MKGLNSKSYLTKSLLNKVYQKKLTNDEIEELVLTGELIKQFSYYQPGESLLRKLDLIPDTVKITNFSWLAKKNAFLLKDIMDIFNCNKDTARIIIKKYFRKRYNYFYKNDAIINILNEGRENVSV
jgi:hypothetical protein